MSKKKSIRAIKPKTPKVIADDCLFKICFGIITNQDIQTNKSGYDVGHMQNYQEYFREAFDESDSLTKFWDKWNFRSDVSDDDRFEFEVFEDDVNMMCNLKDFLKKQNIEFEKAPSHR